MFYRRLIAEGASIPAALRAAQDHLARLGATLASASGELSRRDWMSLQLYASADTRTRLATAHQQRVFLSYHRNDRVRAEALEA